VEMMIVSLSVQMALYGIAWLVIGIGFKLKRQVALLWGAGWLLLSAATGQYQGGPDTFGEYHRLVTNTLVVYGFISLYGGVEAYLGKGPGMRALWLPVLGLLGVELLRLGGEALATPRIWLFTLMICWPLAAAARRIAIGLRAQRNTRRPIVVAVVAPICLVIATVIFRAIWLTLDSATVSDFGTYGEFDVRVSIVFLVVMGAVNFSLAALVLGALITRLRELSSTDQLTGLYNRRVIMHRLAEEHARYQRSGQLYSVIMMDLDRFKGVNDTYGHAVGDQVLKGLASVLKTSQRRTDTLARIGGEEFMLLMPLTDQANAMTHAGRICERVAAACLPTTSGEIRMTISLGVAEVLPTDAAGDAVLVRADAALYRAKESGRNRAEPA
jgi:diguanylate cyclase (GGDEF)-like protein